MSSERYLHVPLEPLGYIFLNSFSRLGNGGSERKIKITCPKLGNRQNQDVNQRQGA